MDDLWRHDAVGLAELIRRGDVTPLNAVHAAIDRIERIDGELNCVVSRLFDRAIQRPDATRGPFAGVPFLLKDAGQELEATPHWLGTRVLHKLGYHSPITTPLARRIEELGFVTIGKSSVPELAANITTEPAEFGPTRNPWALDRTAGGSSGGSAAAVAAGLVPVAHGSDRRGSLRYPAAACGVLTLKPSRDRIGGGVPPAGQPDPERLWADFVLARTARDLRAVFDHLSTGHAAPKRERLRVGLLLHDPLLALPVHPECVHATQLIGTILEARGHHVELDFPPAIEQFLHALLSVQPELAGLRQAQVHWIEARIGRRLHAGDLSQALLDEAAPSQSVNNTDLTAAQEHLRNIGNAIRHWWDNHDLLVTPTLRQPPWLLGATDQHLEAGLFPHPFSVTGQPVLAVPAHHTAAGLPIGVQLAGRMGSDEELLDLAATLESELNWDRRWPPIATAV